MRSLREWSRVALIGLLASVVSIIMQTIGSEATQWRGIPSRQISHVDYLLSELIEVSDKTINRKVLIATLNCGDLRFIEFSEDRGLEEPNGGVALDQQRISGNVLIFRMVRNDPAYMELDTKRPNLHWRATGVPDQDKWTNNAIGDSSLNWVDYRGQIIYVRVSRELEAAKGKNWSFSRNHGSCVLRCGISAGLRRSNCIPSLYSGAVGHANTLLQKISLQQSDDDQTGRRIDEPLRKIREISSINRKLAIIFGDLPFGIYVIFGLIGGGIIWCSFSILEAGRIVSGSFAFALG
jgi:hypothetical protein